MWQKITVIELENHMLIALGNKIQAKQTEEKVYHVILLSGKAPAVTCRLLSFSQYTGNRRRSCFLIIKNEMWYSEKGTEITKLRFTIPKAFQKGSKESLEMI